VKPVLTGGQTDHNHTLHGPCSQFGCTTEHQPTPPMPAHQRFEELPVWQAAAGLYDRVDHFIDRAPPLLRHSFRDQLERATLSVANNIAEGFERGSTHELLAFLYLARGSAGEVRSLLIVGSRRPYLANFRSEILELIKLAESCSRQLRAWANSLQKSLRAGPHRFNRKSRAAYTKHQSSEPGAGAFPQILAQHLPPDHPLHPSRRAPVGPISNLISQI
jgi:four helix bundle protein